MVNEQVYRNTFIESIIALVEKDQGDFLKEVRKLQTNSITAYTVEAAIMDAKEYEVRGSFYHGLAFLQEAIQSQLHGGTNAVLANQYVQLPQFNSPITVSIPAAKNATASTTNAIVYGSGFSLLDVNQISNSTNLVEAVNAVRTSDGQLTLTFSTASTDPTPEFHYEYSWIFLHVPKHQTHGGFAGNNHGDQAVSSEKE